MVLNIEVFSVFPIRILTGLPEPYVLVGAVVHHQVHDYVQIPFFCLGQELIHVLHGAETRINRVVVGDVISLIRQRGAVDGRQPDDIHAQFLQVVQLPDDAPEIADAVSVGVHKAFWIDLISGFSVPPFAFHLHPPPAAERIRPSRHAMFMPP